jgi:hypothetical protein
MPQGADAFAKSFGNRRCCDHPPQIVTLAGSSYRYTDFPSGLRWLTSARIIAAILALGSVGASIDAPRNQSSAPYITERLKFEWEN